MPHVSVLREPERGADVAHGQVAEENTEGREQALAVRQRHTLIAPVAREQEARMKRDAGQALVAQGLLVSFDLVGDGVRLLAQHEGQKVVLVAQVVGSRLASRTARTPQRKPP